MKLSVASQYTFDFRRIKMKLLCAAILVAAFGLASSAFKPPMFTNVGQFGE
jgi:hypothetical protein